MHELPTIEKKIISLLTKIDKPLSKAEIARKINVSPATTAKYVDILVAKKKAKLTSYGNIHLVELGEADAR